MDRRPAVVFALVLVATLVYVFLNVDRGWVPHDEGTLGQTAARVLLGELPHRDFDDMYTGGQALLHAAAFRVAGESLLVLRLTLFLAFALWVPAVWSIARRLAGPEAAAAATLLAVAWSVPNYAASMPSWYNLFLATWGVLALARWEESGRTRWLAAAGVCAGLSILVKIVGLYFVAAVLLYLVYRSQAGRAPSARVARAGDPAPPTEDVERPGRSLHTFLVIGCLTLFALAVVLLVRQRPTPEAVFHFVLPPVACAALLMWREWRMPSSRGGEDFRRLLTQVLVFVGGAAIPVGCFLALYAGAGGLGALYNGVFVLPRQRFSGAWRNPDAIVTTLAILPVFALAVAAFRMRDERASRLVAGVAAVVGGIVVLSGGSTPVYRGVWWGMRALIPLSVMGGLWVLRRVAVAPAQGPRRADPEEAHATSWLPAHSAGSGAGAPRDSLYFLVIAATAMLALVQFPLSAPVYWFYAAPLIALTSLGVFAFGRARPAIPVVLAAFYMLFAVRWFHTGYVYQMGSYYAAHPPTSELRIERGRIRVVEGEKRETETMAGLVDLHARGDYIFATPDAPEVYFLTGKLNPTRTLFDFFDDPIGRDQRLLAMLDERQVNLIVLNESPARFSDPPSKALRAELVARYPRAVKTGRFEVRWRE